MALTEILVRELVMQWTTTKSVDRLDKLLAEDFVYEGVTATI
jgi:hypothetical protein